MAVKAYGAGHWMLIQRHVEGRTDVQCRERWANVLNPNLNLRPWTAEVYIFFSRFCYSYYVISYHCTFIFIGRSKANTLYI